MHNDKKFTLKSFFFGIKSIPCNKITKSIIEGNITKI